MGHHHHHDRRFDPSRIARLDAPERRERMPPAAIARAANVSPTTRVADVGAGSGYYVRALLDGPIAPALVHAIDVSNEMLAALVRTLGAHPHRDRVRTHVAAAEQLPLDDGSVDLLILGNVFHELDDAARALGEARRVLADGGRILVVDWAHRDDATGEPDAGPPWDHRVAESAVRDALGRAGFVSIEAQPGFRDVYALTATRG